MAVFWTVIQINSKSALWDGAFWILLSRTPGDPPTQVWKPLALITSRLLIQLFHYPGFRLGCNFFLCECVCGWGVEGITLGASSSYMATIWAVNQYKIYFSKPRDPGNWLLAACVETCHCSWHLHFWPRQYSMRHDLFRLGASMIDLVSFKKNKVPLAGHKY